MADNACPQCGKQLSLPMIARLHIDRYVQPIMTVTLCCGKAVNVRPRVVYTATAYDGTNPRDDWGNVIK